MWSYRGGGPRSHQGRSLPGPAPHVLPSWVSVVGLHCSPGWPKHQQGVTSVPSPARRDAAACTQLGWRGCTSASLRCFPPPASCRQLGCAPGFAEAGGRGGFLDSCSQAKSTGEAPNWPLPFPAQRCQEHELLLWCQRERSGATRPAFSGPRWAPKHPQTHHGAVYVVPPNRSCFSMAFF